MSSLTVVPHKASRGLVLFLFGMTMTGLVGVMLWVRPFKEGQGGYVLVFLFLGSAAYCVIQGVLWLFCRH